MSSVKKHRIERQFSAAKTPQQNGVAERTNRTVQEAARTMLNESKLPNGYWREAIYTTIYIQNRGQLIMNRDKTPYELCSRDFSLLQERNGSLPSIGRKGRFLYENPENKWTESKKE